MQYRLDADGEKRLAEFVDRIGAVLGNEKRRASFATYAIGLLGDGDRKSMEPIAARACPDPKAVDAAHQRLQHFISDSKWSDRDVRREARRYAMAEITRLNPIEAWILDDTGFLKQGKHSVGVQRQYTGSAGKIANCQIAVSLVVATRQAQLPIDFDLYLPESWTDDAGRRAEARIPEDVVFKSKLDIGLDMIRRAAATDVPRGVVLADSHYGDSADFRSGVRALGLDYAVGVSHNLVVYRVDKAGNRRGRKIALSEIAKSTPRKTVRKVTWREGTKADMAARFAVRRVVPAGKSGGPLSQREAVWLVMEWAPGDRKASKYHFSSLPERTSKKQLVRIIKQRWRTEQAYQELKGELGLDHFEGRRYPGWYHHVSVALCCYAFVAAERSRAFSPSRAGEARDRSKPVAA